MTENRLDMTRVQPPKADDKKKSQTAAPSPAPSMPKQPSPGRASPEREITVVNGIQPKKGSIPNRKRKANALLDEVCRDFCNAFDAVDFRCF